MKIVNIYNFYVINEINEYSYCCDYYVSLERL